MFYIRNISNGNITVLIVNGNFLSQSCVCGKAVFACDMIKNRISVKIRFEAERPYEQIGSFLQECNFRSKTAFVDRYKFLIRYYVIVSRKSINRHRTARKLLIFAACYFRAFEFHDFARKQVRPAVNKSIIADIFRIYRKIIKNSALRRISIIAGISEINKGVRLILKYVPQFR